MFDLTIAMVDGAIAHHHDRERGGATAETLSKGEGMARKTKQARQPKQAVYCACGCGKRTKGGAFAPGHDQRLRGMLLRAEQVKNVTREFIEREKGEWTKLHREGQSRRAKRSAKRPKASRRARRPRAARPPVVNQPQVAAQG